MNTITAREIFPDEPVRYLHSGWEGGTAVSWLYVDSIPDGGVPVIELPAARGWDAYGQSSFLEMSNFDYLQANHGDQLMRIAYVNVESLLVRADQPMPTSVIELTDEDLDMLGLDADEADELQNLAYDLNRLADYPALDEDDLSQREWDVWVETWASNGYNRWALERVLGRKLNTPTEDPDDDEMSLLTQALIDLDAYQGDSGYGELVPACSFEAIAYELTGDERFKEAR